MRQKELGQELDLIKAEVDWMKKILAAQGIEGPWLSPAQAAPILGVGRDKILSEIRLAEQRRGLRKPTDLKYGEAYRNVCAPDAKIPAWQIHLREFGKFLAIPPDKRRI